MKTSRQITSASLTLLMAGSSLLYTTPSSIVKQSPIKMYLIRYKQILKEIVLPSRKQCGIHYNLDTQGYSPKFQRIEKRGVMLLG